MSQNLSHAHIDRAILNDILSPVCRREKKKKSKNIFSYLDYRFPQEILQPLELKAALRDRVRLVPNAKLSELVAVEQLTI